MTTLKGKTAVVTAAGSGIGRASATIMASLGARVLVTDIREESADRVAAEIRAIGGDAAFMRVDVEKPDEIRAMIDRAISHYGGVDVLHNNAALLDLELGKFDHSLLTQSTESWDRVMAVNLRSVMLGCQAAVPHMILRGGGSIINTASILGLTGDVQLPAYSASKAAIIGLSKQIAAEFGKQGIRCNAIAPGIVLTPLVEKFLPPELLQLNLDHSSTPYLGQPDDIGTLVAFLASDSARFITGQVIAIDGGATTHLATVDGYRKFFAKNS
jgi:NAD(P)-dependent dehydrogenase (short-subunit alcohol dehydrogenase family)